MPDVSVQPSASTQASCTATFTQAGTEYLFATFSDDVGDAPSQAELTAEVVNEVATTTSLAPFTTTPVVGQPAFMQLQYPRSYRRRVSKLCQQPGKRAVCRPGLMPGQWY